jgi:hypothetical protein
LGVRTKLVLTLVAGVATLALVAAGCGGDDSSSDGSTTTAAPDEWADGFCTAVSTWTDELQQIGDSIKNPSSLDADTLKQAAEDVNTATDDFVDDVRGLGAPDTESGQAVQDSLDSLADTLESEKNDIEQAVDDISSISGLASALTAIGTSLTAMGTAFQQSLDAIDSADVGDELQTALEDSSACDEIVS